MKMGVQISLRRMGLGKIKLKLTTLPRIFIHVVGRFSSIASQSSVQCYSIAFPIQRIMLLYTYCYSTVALSTTAAVAVRLPLLVSYTKVECRPGWFHVLIQRLFLRVDLFGSPPRKYYQWCNWLQFEKFQAPFKKTAIFTVFCFKKVSLNDHSSLSKPRDVVVRLPTPAQLNSRTTPHTIASHRPCLRRLACSNATLEKTRTIRHNRLNLVLVRACDNIITSEANS